MGVSKKFSGDFKIMIDGMADPVLILGSRSQKFVYSNDAFIKQMGYTSEEVLCLGVKDIHPEKDLSYVLEQLEKQGSGKERLARDIPVKKKDGSVFYADVNATPLLVDGEKYLIGTFRDVTEKKKAGEDLRLSEDRYRRLIEEGVQSVIKLDSDGVILFINEVAAERISTQPQDVIGKTLWDVFPKTLADEYKKSIKETLDAKETRIVERESIVNKKKVWFEAIIQPVQNENGQFDSVIVMAVDVTSRKLIEIELEKSEQKYRNVADFANDGICVIKAARVAYVNRVFEKMLGYEKGGMMDIKFSDFVPPEELQKVREKYMHQLSGVEVAQRYETVVLTQDDRRIQVEASANLIPHDGGQASLVFFRDITKRKAWQRKFEKMNDTLISLGTDFNENVAAITSCCGEMLGGVCALYNKLENGMLVSVGQWQTPPDYKSEDEPEGHICHDLIRGGKLAAPLVIRDLENTKYMKTDSCVAKYGLKTYVGYPVCLGEKCIGSLCIVYLDDVEPTVNDLSFLGILGQALAQEEMRRMSDEKLKNNLEILDNVLSNVPHRVFWKNRDSVYLGCNKGFARDAGLSSPEEIVGKTDYDLAWKKEESDSFREIDENVMSSGLPVLNLEEQQQQADGGQNIVLTSKVPLKDPKGRTVGILGIYTEITERKAASDMERRAKEAVDQILKIVPSGVFTVDLEHRVTKWNDKAEEITGYSSEEMLGTNCSVFAKCPSSEKCALLSKDVEMPVVGSECEIETKDGRWRIVSKNMDVIKDSEGNIIGAVESFEDITHRKMMDIALKDSSEKYRMIFNNAGTAIILIDDEMKATMVNAEFERLIGRTREEIEGKLSIEDFVYEADKAKVREYHWLRRLAPETPPKEYELRVVDKGGEIKYVHVTVSLMPGENQSLVALADVTKIKMAQETLTEQKDLLNEANIVLENKVKELQEAAQHINKLEGLVPICAACKKMFSEDKEEGKEGEWVPLEKYISERSEASFTHGLCPDCVNRLYGDRTKKRPRTGG